MTFRPLRTQPRTNSEKRIWEAHPCGFCKGGIFSAFSSFQFLFSSCAREKNAAGETRNRLLNFSMWPLFRSRFLCRTSGSWLRSAREELPAARHPESNDALLRKLQSKSARPRRIFLFLGWVFLARQLVQNRQAFLMLTPGGGRLRRAEFSLHIFRVLP